MKCPVCKTNISELDEICPKCKTNFDEYEQEKRKFHEEEKRTNADCLNAMANLNIILSIIGAIAIWFNFSTIEYISGYSETNWYGIIGGITVLVAGFTLFFLLKTIVDIYWKVER